MYSRELILSAMQFEIADAYWISPSGRVRPVGITHIEDVVDHPVAFGLTNKAVKDTYKNYGEKLRLEGKARDEIVGNLILRDWIRIRYVVSKDYYSIDVGGLTKKVKEYLLEWACKIIELKPVHKYSEVVMAVFSTGVDLCCTVEDLTGEVLLSRKEQQEPISDYLVPLRLKDDFLDMGPVGRMERNIKEARQAQKNPGRQAGRSG